MWDYDYFAYITNNIKINKPKLWLSNKLRIFTKIMKYLYFKKYIYKSHPLNFFSFHFCPYSFHFFFKLSNSSYNPFLM